MKNKMSICMLLLIVFQINSVGFKTFRGIPIEELNKTNINLGYDNSNMNTNGEVMVIEHLIPHSVVAFDVGANIGTWSGHVLKLNSNLKIYAFEPIPHVFSILTTNINSTLFDFHPYQLGLSDVNSQKNFYIYSKNVETTGLSTCYRREEAIEKRIGLVPTEVNITTKRLDSFCEEQGISHIDYLKIDTEGSEFDVIKGAVGMLQKKSIGAIQFEYGGTFLSAHIKLQDLFFFLDSYGYKVFHILPDKLINISEWRTELENYKYSNFLAIASELLC